MKDHSVLLAALAAPMLAACETQHLDATQLVPNSLVDSLIAHYRFDEDGGTVIHDSSGQKRNGALSPNGDAGTWLVDGGKFGGALRLSSGDYVIIDNFPNASQDFTASVWIRTATAPLSGPPTFQFGTILSTEAKQAGGWQFNLEGIDGGIATHFAYWESPPDNRALARCTCVVPNQWMHFVAVVDSASHSLTLYVDGVADPALTGVPAILPGAPALSIGTWSGSGPSRYYVGDIDDVAIYGRALAPAEVKQLDTSTPPDMP
jgi:hypothetical protein